MTDNYGMGGYGLGTRKQFDSNAATAASFLVPGFGLVRAGVGLAAAPIGGAIDASHKVNQEINTKSKGDTNAAHQSPFGVMGELESHILPGSEKLMPANTKPLEVAPAETAKQSTFVDSSQSPFMNSAMQDYLNYMKYRGGY